ncbi:hypothetical protein HanPI659440_Chr13g0499631 [Helianthus annuus]|nr:hypothetical protein HanPI659440_Chr13g0499631 [Helianthus annuus]
MQIFFFFWQHKENKKTGVGIWNSHRNITYNIIKVLCIFIASFLNKVYSCTV